MIDLMKEYGKRYKITMEESWEHEIQENRALWKKNGEIAWYYEIRGKRGYIYPQKENAFALEVKPRVYKAAISEKPTPFKTFRDPAGRHEIVFSETDIEIALEWIQPKKRRVLTQEQRARNIERLAKFRFSSARHERLGQ